MHISFEYPIAFLLLPLVLCFVYCKKHNKPFYIPKLEYISSKRRWIDLYSLLKILTFLLLIITLSAPFFYRSILPSKREGRAIVLALDSSGSMRESSFGKSDKSKFDIVLELVNDFIDKRVVDNIGIVAFGTFAFSAAPVTYDHEALKEILNMLEVEIAGKNTAIADAIKESIKNLSYSKAKEKIVLLLTDGENNSGTISINDAINLAKSKKIKVYTIGIGDEKNYDKKVLEYISSKTFAKSFSAKDKQELKKVYEEIDRLLKSKIRSENYVDKRYIYTPILLISILLSLYLLFKEEGLA